MIKSFLASNEPLEAIFEPEYGENDSENAPDVKAPQNDECLRAV